MVDTQSEFLKSSKMNRYTQQLKLDTSAEPPDSITDLDWSFSGVDTEYLTHGLHKYPAVMPPQIPANVFQYYKANNTISEGDTVYDPFIGSGTTIVEARLHGFDAIGNDINPFACLLTEVKTNVVDLQELKEATADLFKGLDTTFARLTAAYENQHEQSGTESGTTQIQLTLSDVDNTLTADDAADDLLESLSNSKLKPDWYPKPQLYHLLYTRQRLNKLSTIHDDGAIQFLRIVLSKIARQVSYQRRNCFKRWRMEPKDQADHDPNVYGLLQKELRENRQKIREFNQHIDPSTSTTIFQGDSRTVTQSDAPVETESADIVVTSPPYGDHQTTVAYGEFSTDLAIVAENRDFAEMREVDKQGLGGQPTSLGNDPRTVSESLAESITHLRNIEGRSEDALTFFWDYAMVIEEVGKIIKGGQPVVWVVANRRVSNNEMPMSAITAELCESAGFSHETTINRGIKGKNMPQQNAQGQTIVEEYIVVTEGPEQVIPLTSSE